MVCAAAEDQSARQSRHEKSRSANSNKFGLRLEIGPYQFSIRVSDILRRYVTQQYGVPATRQTSVEFLAAAAKAPSFSADDKSLLEDF